MRPISIEDAARAVLILAGMIVMVGGGAVLGTLLTVLGIAQADRHEARVRARGSDPA